MRKDGHAGALDGKWSGPFKPVLWIGDESRGLSWVSESQQHWHPAQRDRAVEVLPGDSATLLRFNLIGLGTRVRHVSYWRHPHNGILLVVSNLNAAAQEATISIDPSRLGLHPDLAASV